MIVSKSFKIFETYVNYIYKKNNTILKSNNKRLFLHLFKSDFIVILAVKITFYLINLASYFFFFKGIYSINEKKQIKIIKFLSIILSPLFIKIDELIYTIIFIQNNEFKEKTSFKNYNKIKKNDYTHIVIGSGPSGSISSYYLNEYFNNKDTLLVERGSGYSTYETKHPSDEFIYKWKNGGVNTSLFSTPIVFSSGECLGGGSEINSGLLHEPDETYLASWNNDFGLKNITKDVLINCLKEVKKICNYSFIEKSYLSSYNFFKKGAETNNYKIEKLPVLEEIKNTKKQKNSMSNTFIKKYLENSGKVLSKFDVKKIYFDNNQWFLDGIKDKKKLTLSCKYLFLCCGSVETNKLLINSKIKTITSPKKYYLHPMIKLIAEFDQDVQIGKENVHPYQVTEFFPKFILGEAASGKRFLKMATIDNTELQKDIEKNWQKMSIYHATLSIGEGNIRKIPFTNSFIKSYKIKETEIDLLIMSYIKLCNILFDGGAKNIYLLNKKIIKVNKDNYQEKIYKLKKIKDYKFSSVHILGGITSGENKNCITDSFGKVNGLKNLYVNDSSLINSKLLKNPQGMVMSIAKNNIDNFIKNSK